MSKERLPPEVLQAVKSIETVEILTEILETLKATIPDGIVKPMEVSVTDEWASIKWSPQISPRPWFSFYMINDGPDPVYFAVNEKVLERRVPIKAGEDVTVDMESPKIRSVYLICDEGKKATVRIWLKS